MLNLIIVLSVFLVLFAMMGWFVIMRLNNDNQNLLTRISTLETTNAGLEKEKADMKKQLDELMAKPSIAALSYKTDKKDIDAILQNVQKIYLDFQKEGCNQIKDNFNDTKKTAFTTQVTTAATGNPVTNCDDVSTRYESAINTLVTGLTPNTNTSITAEQQTVLRKYLKDLVVSVMKAVCKNGTMNTTDLMKVLTDVFDAICYMR